MPTKLELLERTLEQGFPIDEDIPTALSDQERVERLRQTVKAVAVEDLVVEMVGNQGFRTERRGVDGFVEAWRDWVSPFETFRVAIEDVIDSGNHLVVLVTQHAKAHDTDIEIASDSAAVWTFEGDRLARVGFYLDRDDARRAAEISA